MKTSSRGSVVEPCDHADLDRVPNETPRPRPPPRLQTLEQRSTLFCDRACGRRAQPAVNDSPVGLARKGAGRRPSEGRGANCREATNVRHQGPTSIRPREGGTRPRGRTDRVLSPTRRAVCRDGACRARTGDPQLADSPAGWSQCVSGGRRRGSKPLLRETSSPWVAVRRRDLTRI